MEWLNNLSKAIDYIEKNLDGEISYSEAAKIACCSTNYFQRMFSYVVGISLSEYIRYRRMSQAAFELQKTERKVMEVALDYGYTSPTAFNRAFQSVHGISPILAKMSGCKLNAYPPIKLSVQVIGGENMPYRIEEKSKFRVVGRRIPLTEDMEENQKIVPEFWNEQLKKNKIEEISMLSNQEPTGVFGITAEQKSNEIYYYIAVATDKEVPEQMFELEIPSATWVIFEQEGPYKESVQNIFKRFLTEWLPFSGYSYAGLPDLEVYPLNNNNTTKGCSQVWIAVRKE